MPFQSLHDSQNRQNSFESGVVGRSWLAGAIRRPHQEREVARSRLNEKLLVHVFLASYVQPVQSAGIELMREVPLDPFSTLPLQTPATIPMNPPPITVHRCLLRRLAIPVAGATIRLRDVGPHFHLTQAKRNVIAV